MLAIRLSRMGKKKHPIFRVIVSEKAKDTFGDYLELLGQYNPHTNKAKLNAERIKYWISQGAKPSGTVHNLLIDQKIISGEKLKVANIKKSAKGGSASGGKKEEKAEEKTQQPAPTGESVETKEKTEEKKEEPATKLATDEKKPEETKDNTPKTEDKPAEKKGTEEKKSD